MTKGEVDRLGEKIRGNSGDLDNNILNELEFYRKSYKDSLAEAFNIICQKRFKVSREIIVTYRIKRIESIISKLKRYPEMRFSRMWDIGGCRIITKNNEEVYKLREIIHSQFKVIKENNYLNEAQDDGYKSLHIYVSVPNSNLIIEIQLRNLEDHNWSTLVEISDLLFDAGLKEYKKNKKLLQFHKLLSNFQNLDFYTAKTIVDIEKDYKYSDTLQSVFSRNYLDIREQWLEIEHKSSNKYFLIESKKNQTTKIEAFNNFFEAENEYFKKYKESEDSHIVLTHLPTPEFNKISIAYSNYILSTHNYENQILIILEKVMLGYLSQQRLWKFYFYYNYYQKIKVQKIQSYLRELKRSYLVLSSKPQRTKRKLRKKYDEWKRDIRIEMKNHDSSDKKFALEFMKIYPQSPVLTKFILKRIFDYSGWIFKRKLKREINNLNKL